jgi:hypothetical protein
MKALDTSLGAAHELTRARRNAWSDKKQRTAASMQRIKSGFCAPLLCCLMLAGCGGGIENASNGLKQADPSAKTAAASGSDPMAEPPLTVTAAGAHSKADELLPAIRPLARSPFAFARNGQFHVYAGNGSRQRLELNFDTKSYTVTDNLRQVTSGIFSEDATEPGTYIFASDRITSAVNTARFRVTADAVVGSFPFEKPWSNPVAYQVMPFVAARAFVTDPAQLDGSYNRFGISHNSNGTSDSQILAMRISAGGTTLEMCFDNAIYRIESCPVASKRTYAVTASPDSVWTAINIAAPSDLLQFRMARIGGKNVWLSGGYTDAAPNVHVFRVGLQDSPGWPKIRYVGASTDGSWGANVFNANTSVRSAITPEGITGDLSLPFASIGGPTGIRILNAAGPKKYFAMQNGVVSVIVGTRNPGTAGYIQVNLAKDQLDARSGQYTVFAANGTEQTLDIDFETQRYSMSAAGGGTATGTFSEDANDRGTYIFASERIATVLSTARFRTTTDAIVGSFPFPIFRSDPIGYAIQPFIAARSFVTNRNELMGLYDVVPEAATTNNSVFIADYWQLYIDSAGLTAQQCFAAAETSLCPSSSSLDSNYSISAGPSPDKWLLKQGESAAFTISIAKIGGRKVLLQAFPSYFPAIPADSIPIGILMTGFAQPVPGSSDTSWPALNMHSVSTASTFGTATLDANSYETHYAQADGAPGALTLTLQPNTSNFQVREGRDSNGTTYLVLQNGAMNLTVTRGPTLHQLHIGLVN